jgi:carbamoyl-phosphate synthase small subunit
MGIKAFLVLADGTCFEGRNFGAEGETIGEVVFNTSMTGYQEILTDPSYKGQIVAMTSSQMGNYGVNPMDVESGSGPKAEGFVVKEYLDFPSNWRSSGSLGDYLTENNIVGIEGIDTRALTRHIRDEGAQMGIISTAEDDPKKLYEKAKAHPGIGALDLVRDVTSQEPYAWSEGKWAWEKTDSRGLKPLKMVVYDYGVKYNILRCLVDAGFDVTVVPAATQVEEVLNLNPDGVLFSNGQPRDRYIRHRGRKADYGQKAAFRHMPRPPDTGPCAWRKNVQAKVRPPRREPPGDGPRNRKGRDNLTKPQLLRRRKRARGQGRHDP